ncbi:class I SAM-dependent methyltransferase [Patescibacteria group bacterium]
MNVRNIISKTKRDYNIIAKHFSDKRQYLWEELKPFLTYVKKNNTVLDVGCGNGRLYGELKKRKIKYLGLDYSDKLLKIAKKHYPKAKFKNLDISKTKSWKNITNFDISFCLAVLHHFPTKKSQLAVLYQIYKSLKPKGILILSVWNLWQTKYWQMHMDNLGWKLVKGFKLRWIKVPYKISDGVKVIKRVNRFCYCFSLRELEDLLQAAGFTILEKKTGKNLCLVAKKLV